jgi:hypothetical protein
LYLSTDDVGVVEQALADERFKVLHISFDRQVFDNNWFIEYRMAEGAVDTKMVSESAVLDAMLLADCDYLVGRCRSTHLPVLCVTLHSFTSHFSRLALELMTARMGFVPPFISIDKPYGMHGENMPAQLNQVIA